MYFYGVAQAIIIAISYYLLVVFLPSLILGERFKNETITKRLMVYLVFGNIYLSTIVFTLAYLNLFTRLSLVFSLVITAILLYTLFNRQHLLEKILRRKAAIKEVLLGEYGFRLFLSNKIKNARRYLKNVYYKIIYGNEIEGLIFLAILSYLLYHYGISSAEYMTYMAPDEEIHLYWIQSLLKGDIFPSGVYPHVFHTVLAAIVKLFNINAMKMIIYFGGTANILIMTMLYMGLRKIFKSKYAALFGFMLYAIFNIFLGVATYRFQLSIPQEYAMIFLMPMALFLFAYIKEQQLSDLVFFGLALALSVGTHFYTGAIAVILAVAIGLTYLYRIIRKKMLGKLILTGLLSAVVALAPLGIGLATGYELEQSFTWGSEVIKGDIYSTTSEGVLKEDLEPEEETTLTLDQFVTGAKNDLEKYVVHNVETMYVLVSIILFTLLYNLIYLFDKKDDSESEYQIAFAINSLFLLLLILFKSLKLPTIMEPKRLAIYFAYFSPVFLGMPLEIASRFLRHTKLKKAMPSMSIGIILASFLLILNFDRVKPLPPFYYIQTTGTTLANKKIMEEYEDYTWTAISPVNNISLVMGNGFHYELDEFILQQENWHQRKEIYIPTEYVFLYIEKKPIIDYGFESVRESFALKNRPEIRKEDALQDLKETSEDNYHYIRERNILMAKAYEWAQVYQDYFPKEAEVYYEDDELIVYRIKQNVNALNNLSIDYGLNSR